MATSRFPIIRGDDAQQSRTQDNISATLEPIAKALQNTPIMGAPPPPLVIPSLLNGFSAVSGYKLGYRVSALRELRVTGRVSVAVLTAATTVIFNLPVGLRPSGYKNFAVFGAAAPTAIAVGENGDVLTLFAMNPGDAVCLEFSFQLET